MVRIGAEGAFLSPVTHMSKSEFRANLIRLRNDRGWSQQDLARRARLGQSTVSRLESGGRTDPGWSTIVALARALGVEPEELTGERPMTNGRAPTSLRMRRVKGSDLLNPYINSQWATDDDPSTEELKWLSSQPVIWLPPEAPLDFIAHEMIMGERNAKTQ